MIPAYPLAWPEGWKRTPPLRRRSATFGRQERQYSSDGQHSWKQKRGLTVTDSVERVLRALESMRIDRKDVVISTNVRTRLDGLPRSGERKPEDPGAAVYWQDRGGAAPRVMAVDQYDDVADNLAAIASTLDAMRAIERHGGAAILERAFTGFAALPAPGQTSRTWRDVLGFTPQDRVDLDAVKVAHARLSKLRHPDLGGTHEAMVELNAAREDALRQIGART